MTNPNVRPDLEALKVLLERVSLPVRAVDMHYYAELLDRRDAKIALTTGPALLVAAVNALPDLIAHIERLEATLQRIADDGPATDPGPAYDDGWVSHGNYDDVAHDSRQEVRWAHAQLARATLSQVTSND